MSGKTSWSDVITKNYLSRSSDNANVIIRGKLVVQMVINDLVSVVDHATAVGEGGAETRAPPKVWVLAEKQNTQLILNNMGPYLKILYTYKGIAKLLPLF